MSALTGGMLIYAVHQDGPYQLALDETLRCLKYYKQTGRVTITSGAGMAVHGRPDGGLGGGVSYVTATVLGLPVTTLGAVPLPPAAEYPQKLLHAAHSTAAPSGASTPILPRLEMGKSLDLFAEMHTKTSLVKDPAVYAACVPVQSALLTDPPYLLPPGDVHTESPAAPVTVTYVGGSHHAESRVVGDHLSGKGSAAFAGLVQDSQIAEPGKRGARFCLMGYDEIHPELRQAVIGDAPCIRAVSFVIHLAEQSSLEQIFHMGLPLANQNKGAFGHGYAAYASANGAL
jgi:hypothetical protein